MKRTLFAALTLLLLGGCAHVLSQEALLAVDPVAEFAQVKAAPAAHQGKTLLLGGLLVDARINREGTTLEVLRYTLDRYGEPQRPDEAGGRFLARTERFLDPELYRAGRLVTLTGVVSGQETRPLGEVSYTYPVFRVGELYLWPPGPRHPYYYYDPFYRPGPYRFYYGGWYRGPYDYYFDPYWHGPGYPWRRWP